MVLWQEKTCSGVIPASATTAPLPNSSSLSFRGHGTGEVACSLVSKQQQCYCSTPAMTLANFIKADRMHSEPRHSWQADFAMQIQREIHDKEAVMHQHAQQEEYKAAAAERDSIQLLQVGHCF